MLALIGDFKFEINKASFDKITHNFTFDFATHKRLKNFSSYQAVGLHEESIEIEGELIAESQGVLVQFEMMAKEKKELTFVTGNIVKTVLITNLKKEKSYFVKDGYFISQTYKIDLTVTGGGIPWNM